jgi:hypothetical protein
MKRNIVTQRLAMVVAAALAVGLLASDAQARGGGSFGGGHGLEADSMAITAMLSSMAAARLTARTSRRTAAANTALL